jgi:hypothetical protein
MDMIYIGHRGFNISEVEKLTEKEFIKAFEPHYRKIGKGRIDKIKSDYKELKKSFTKKAKKIEKESD